MIKHTIVSKYLFLFSCICVFFLSSTVYAKTEKLSGIYFLQKIHQEDQTEGKAFLLFCDVQIQGHHKGDLHIFKGSTEIKGQIEGNIYLYEGRLSLGSQAKIYGQIYTLLGQVYKQPETYIEKEVHSLQPTFSSLKKIIPIPDFLQEAEELPHIMLLTIRILVQILIGFMILSLHKKFIEEGSMILYHQRHQVFRSGGILFLMFALLIGLFTLSLIGFPVALLFILFLWVVSLIGQIMIAVCIGRIIEIKMKTEWHIYIYYLLGISIIQLVIVIPFLGYVFKLIGIPWFSLGILARQYINKKYIRLLLIGLKNEKLE